MAEVRPECAARCPYADLARIHFRCETPTNKADVAAVRPQDWYWSSLHHSHWTMWAVVITVRQLRLEGDAPL